MLPALIRVDHHATESAVYLGSVMVGYHLRREDAEEQASRLRAELAAQAPKPIAEGERERLVAAVDEIRADLHRSREKGDSYGLDNVTDGLAELRAQLAAQPPLAPVEDQRQLTPADLELLTAAAIALAVCAPRLEAVEPTYASELRYWSADLHNLIRRLEGK